MATMKVAFPISTETTDTGMSLRDYFAGQALSALANFKAYEPGEPNDQELAANVARSCYILADAMLSERAKWR